MQPDAETPRTDAAAGPDGDERRQLRALLDTVKRIAALTPPETLLETIAAAAAALSGFEAGGFRLVEGDELAVAGQWGDPAMLRPRIKIGESLSGRAAATGEVIVVDDLPNDPRLDPLHRAADRRLGYQTLVAVPLRIGPRITGVLVLRSRARRRPSPDELAIVQAFADHAAVALENARLYAAEQRQRQQAEALTEIARDVSAALDRDTVLQRVIEHARRLCRADLVMLALCEPGGPEATVVARTGHRTDIYDRAVVRAGEGLAGQALATRTPVTTADRLTDPRWPPDEPARVEGLRATAAVPVLAGDALLGVLWVHRRTAEPFDPHDVSTVEALARHAAVAIQNAALYATAQARAAEVQLLRGVGLNLSRSLELPRVLQEIVDAAREGTGSDAAFCAVVDPATLDVETVASSGARSTAFARYRLQPGQGIGGWFLLHKRPFRTDDYLGDPRFAHAFDEAARAEGIVTSLGVPILHQEELIGVLWVFNRSARPFSERDEAFMAGLGDHAAVALVNARAHAERQRALEELRASQDRLVQAERLRALGEMASGVAHDFNNLLAVILGRVQLLLLRAQDADLRRGLTIIERAAADAAHTVRRIQEFTRTRQTQVFEPVDLREIVREAVELTKGRWKDEAQVRGVTYAVSTDLGKAPLIAGEAAELREVFTNLVLNAVDAMPQGGRIDLAVGHDAEAVIATVRDTGPGMPPEVRERVFEPFFTTKGPRSTGLGLSVAYGIVKRHGGRIDVESREGRGAQFTVRLPRLEGRQVPRLPDRPAATLHGGRPARVLVIDDEASVRVLIADILRAAGHLPLAAEDGPTGLALVERAGAPDLALIDLGLPGMSGWEVAARLRASRPEVPLVLITGWGDRLDPADLERSGICQVIAKPFQTTEVLRVVAERAASSERPGGI
ncbi:MAG: GAF domain-containing protein [Candidatus Rokubacteria bacterium]|nr:GAF domain-containing protein [Candidatus Rokubacteria bacterium]